MELEGKEGKEVKGKANESKKGKEVKGKGTTPSLSRHAAERTRLHMNITPQEYRGMHLLGNFSRQFIWRPNQDFELQDHRVALLPSSLFKNKTVLDVGCGEGKVAIEVAMRYFPLKMVALDIDSKLLQTASKLAEKMVARN